MNNWIIEEDSELAARFTAYLHRCLQNERAKYLNRLYSEYHNECSLEEADEAILSYDQMERSVEASMMWQTLKSYIKYLTSRESEVLICMCIDRMSVTQTAEKLNMSVSTVYWHKRNALGKIRKYMGEDQ